MKLSLIENPISDAAIKCFVRFGARKTSMSDIAKEAGISRPTLYASYKNKDEVFAGVIRHGAMLRLCAFQERCKETEILGEQLNIYFEDVIISSYDFLKDSQDGQMTSYGSTEISHNALAETRLWARDTVAEILMPYQDKIMSTGQTVEQLAHFTVSASAGFRLIISNRDELLSLLLSLKAIVLAIAED